MSSWAPHLLRLYQYTKRDIFLTYARNAVIGRFTNYPGYYGTGFTDIVLQPDFPYKGPDVSSIYYHHIPPHLAFTWDYLVTEAVQRSGNKVSFPYSKQDGFVWFTNRHYGAGTGICFDDKNARLWMKRALVQVNSPEVNYITAVSDNKFWVILLNESANALPVTVQLSNETGVANNAAATVFAGEKGKSSKAALNNNVITANVDAKGIIAISFPLTTVVPKTSIPALNDGMKVIALGEPWGKLFVFRIRSPFGWDSIYGFTETGGTGDQITVKYKEQFITKDAYPFEFGFYKLPANEKATLSIQLQSKSKEVLEKTITLEGN